MKTAREIALGLLEDFDDGGLKKMPWQKDPKIGWWKDEHPDHYVMYHGTHERNLAGIARNGINSPSKGSTAGNVSMTHDPYTAHAYAAMSGSGGETGFRNAGQKAQNTPHEHRAVVVAHIPKDWAHQNMNHDMRGNVPETRNKLTDKSTYDAHKDAGKPDFQHYQATELRFKDKIPPHFIKGYMKKAG